jgi:hypothetical protein
MENKEFTYQGKTLNGILMLVLNIIGFLAGVGLFIFACVSQEDWLTNVCGVCGVLLLILSIICVCGFILVEPGQARVLLFFGKYRGTFTEPGYYWLNPFISQKKLSLRVRNLDAEPIKVNDKTGNPAGQHGRIPQGYAGRDVRRNVGHRVGPGTGRNGRCDRFAETSSGNAGRSR